MTSEIIERIAFVLIEYIDATEDLKRGISIARSTSGSELGELLSGLEKLRGLRRGLGESLISLARLVESGEAEIETLRDADSLLNYYLLVASRIESEILREASDIVDTRRDLEDVDYLKDIVETLLLKIGSYSKS